MSAPDPDDTDRPLVQSRQGDDVWLSMSPSGPPPGSSDGRAELVEALRLAVDAARNDGARAVHWEVDSPPGPTGTALEHWIDGVAVEAGLTLTRRVLQLRRALPLEPHLTASAAHPPLRAFRPGTADEQAWVRTNARAFRDHPDQGRRTLEDLRATMAGEWFRSEDLLLLDAVPGVDEGGSLAGSCWTRVHPAGEADPARGEIYVIGVDPDHAGQGLGRALVVAGLEHLAERVECALLYVESDNTAARALYDSLGFTLHGVRHVRSAVLSPGDAPVAPTASGETGAPTPTPGPSRRRPRTRFDLSRDELGALLADQPRYRTDQVWRGLHEQLREPDEMTDVPLVLRERLEVALPSALTLTAESTSDGGDTVKWLWDLEGGARVETVLMHYPQRSTVCVSSQAGCAMACGFCATGQAGFTRHLGAGEIVEQVARAARRARDDGRRLANVVFMGMGEPLANYDATWTAIRRIHGDLGIGARHITVSTVGLVPGILRMAAEDLPVNLAVSLHAADDALRDELVPINRRHPLAELAEACRTHIEATGRRLSLEWALIAGVNDRPADAVRLAALARDLRAHVNLIPLNPTPGYLTRGSTPAVVDAFRDRLLDRGVNVTVRDTRGTSIDAACGQLAAGMAAVAPPGRRRLPDRSSRPMGTTAPQ